MAGWRNPLMMLLRGEYRGGIDWGRAWHERMFRPLPYPLLAISLVVALAGPDRPGSERAVIGLLSIGAAGWVAGMYTFAPAAWRAKSWWLAAYFAGFLVFGAALISQDLMFFIFVISGFFHAYLLRPPWLAVVGVAGTSIIINTGTMGFPQLNPQSLVPYVLVIGIQTLAISSGIVFGEQMAKQLQRRREATAKLEAALEENAGLHAQLLRQAREAGIDDERQRMAREIHDTLAQGLAGIITQLEAARQAKDQPPVWERHLDNASALARSSLSDARRTVHAVRPEPLEAARLPEALSDVAATWSQLSEVPAEVTTTGTARPLYPEVEVTLLRVGQEALSNVAKHARASRVHLTLSYMEDVVTLDVRDDGIGFDPAVHAGGTSGHGGFGLTGMRQRVRRLTGVLEVETEPGGGTAISARVPAIPAMAGEESLP